MPIPRPGQSAWVSLVTAAGLQEFTVLRRRLQQKEPRFAAECGLFARLTADAWAVDADGRELRVRGVFSQSWADGVEG